MPETRLRAPRGTFDVLGDAGARRNQLRRLGEDLLERAGYQYCETPIFEDTELFARGVGQTTDIVQKEMFTFEDAGGRSLTLRPEGTAGICRSYIEHGMHRDPQPVKLWYQGPFFRHEAPQAGRFRQFSQIGAEALGSSDASLDAEMILLLAELLQQAGVCEAELKLSSLGTPQTRRAYSRELSEYLRTREAELAADVRDRIDTNPLRAFDSKDPQTRRVLSEAPKLLDRLDSDDQAHFAEVRQLLEQSGIAYEIDPTLVRGLDYYTRTVFEFTSPRLGAQSGLGGGGRYDGLVEQLGGRPTPAVGWAAGIERVLLASSEADLSFQGRSGRSVFVAMESSDSVTEAFLLARDLRARGVAAQLEQAGRSLKGQLKHADRLGVRSVVITGADGLTVRDMQSGEQSHAASRGQAVELLTSDGR